MTPATFTLGVPNGLLIFRDSSLQEYPHVDGLANFWKTDSCVIVSCDADIDGETTINVNHGDSERTGLVHLVDVSLNIPSSHLVCEVVPSKRVFDFPLKRNRADIRVWTDGQHGTQIVFMEVR
jgi:hypothetical protein